MVQSFNPKRDGSRALVHELRLGTGKTQMLTADMLRQRFDYNPEMGTFVYLHDVGKLRAGNAAGWRDVRGYQKIQIDGREYKAHRLAWLYMTGSWPNKMIDHANGDTGDNRFANLREATSSQNSANSRTYATNTTGLRGVRYQRRDGRWYAILKADGRRMHLGSYASKEEAAEVYRLASAWYFGRFARTTAIPGLDKEFIDGKARALSQVIEGFAAMHDMASEQIGVALAKVVADWPPLMRKAWLALLRSMETD